MRSGSIEPSPSFFALNDVSTDILTANIDFARKLSIVRSAIDEQNESPKEKWLTDEISEVLDGIFRINDERIILAHSPFGENGTDGVTFKRIIARKKLVRSEIVWSKSDFESRFSQMQSLEHALDVVLKHIEPYVAKLDFSDPRNSGYLGAL